MSCSVGSQEERRCEPLVRCQHYGEQLDRFSLPVLSVLSLTGQDTQEPLYTVEQHCPSSSASSHSLPTPEVVLKVWGYLMCLAGGICGVKETPVISLLFWGYPPAVFISTLPKWRVLRKLHISVAEGSLTHFCWTGTDSVKAGHATTTVPSPMPVPAPSIAAESVWTQVLRADWLTSKAGHWVEGQWKRKCLENAQFWRGGWKWC